MKTTAKAIRIKISSHVLAYATIVRFRGILWNQLLLFNFSTICLERAKLINKTTNTANTENMERLIKKNKLHTHPHKVASDELTIDGNDNEMLW